MMFLLFLISGCLFYGVLLYTYRKKLKGRYNLAFFLVFVVICFYFNLSVCSYLAERIEIEPMKVKKRENELDKSIHKPLFFGKQLMQKTREIEITSLKSKPLLWPHLRNGNKQRAYDEERKYKEDKNILPPDDSNNLEFNAFIKKGKLMLCLSFALLFASIEV